MILKFIRIRDLSTRLVGFYTVQVEGEELSEFEKFDAKAFPENQKDFDRIYSILLRMGERLVILLNGDVKTHLNPKQCPNVRKHFDFAIRLSTLIDKAKFDKIIQWDPDNTWIITDNEYIEI
ncbi:hypothetical protein [Sediminibacterium sp. TEGAF015]|uniref:hypothetical protein n=1 Tax=Sediminibacterium sp. TEGAF015 TaxID=575378 RepID=UPI0022005972|nr:hypothetical protein [Sediminibacterium sp. TEGAF015]BDQ11648.1 hypothetical protein TEGAF0_08650 [Sediminibacterium sp. TEGAF015]